MNSSTSAQPGRLMNSAKGAITAPCSQSAARPSAAGARANRRAASASSRADSALARTAGSGLASTVTMPTAIAAAITAYAIVQPP